MVINPMTGAGHLTGRQPAVLTFQQQSTHGSGGPHIRRLVFSAPVLAKRITIRIHAEKTAGVNGGTPTITIFKRDQETDKLIWDFNLDQIASNTGQHLVFSSDVDTIEQFGENDDIRIEYFGGQFTPGDMFTLTVNITVIGTFI